MSPYADWNVDTSISTLSYTTSVTNVVVHETHHPDTVVTDTSTAILPFTSSLLVTFDLAARLPTNNAGVGPTPTQSELRDITTVVYAQTVYASESPLCNMTKLMRLTAHRPQISSSTEQQRSSLSLLSPIPMVNSLVSQRLPISHPPWPLPQVPFYFLGSIRMQRRILVVGARLIPASTNSFLFRLLMSPRPL